VLTLPFSKVRAALGSYHSNFLATQILFAFQKLNLSEGFKSSENYDFIMRFNWKNSLIC